MKQRTGKAWLILLSAFITFTACGKSGDAPAATAETGTTAVTTASSDTEYIGTTAQEETTSPVTGHLPGEEELFMPPTCTEEGICCVCCSLCGEELERFPVPPTGHTVEVREETVKPGILTEGTAEGICTLCHESCTVPVPPLGNEKTKTNITDKEVLPYLEKMVTLAASGHQISVSYINPADGSYFSYDGAYTYRTQSVIKAIYAQYLFDSGADMDEEITFAVNTGYVSKVLLPWKVGTKYTVGKLVELALRRSDNEAYHLLIRRFGTEDFDRYVEETLGLDTPRLAGKEFTTGTCDDLAAAMLYMYRYSLTDGTLMEHLLNATYSHYISEGTDWPVAHKYGMYDGRDYHDMAVVYYEDAPFILVICTYSGQCDYDRFHKLTALACEAHGALTKNP